jgi:hypothetical protein
VSKATDKTALNCRSLLIRFSQKIFQVPVVSKLYSNSDTVARAEENLEAEHVFVDQVSGSVKVRDRAGGSWIS